MGIDTGKGWLKDQGKGGGKGRTVTRAGTEEGRRRGAEVETRGREEHLQSLWHRFSYLYEQREDRCLSEKIMRRSCCCREHVAYRMTLKCGNSAGRQCGRRSVASPTEVALRRRYGLRRNAGGNEVTQDDA